VSPANAQRGQVFRVDLGHGAKPWLVVSNNQRNRNLDSVLAARITTTGKHSALPTVVPLGAGDPLVGYVLCDDLIQLYQDELTRALGALAPPTMAAVSRGLAIALGLR
jgi:mRNA interferase MazF